MFIFLLDYSGPNITAYEHTMQSESKAYRNYMELNGRLPTAVEASFPMCSFSKVEGSSTESIQYS
jgi:hypothetical protein